MIVFLKLLEPLGYYLGPTFSLTPNVGSAIPSTATRQQLLTGINVIVSDGATHIKIKSLGEQCSTEVEYPIGIPTTTTTTTIAPPTTTTTTSGLTTTTTTTSTTTTTTVNSDFCITFGTESFIPLNLDIPSLGNAPFQNDRPVYNLSDFFGVGVTAYIYYDGTQWVYFNSDLGGVFQTLASTSNYPISDGVTAPFWNPPCLLCTTRGAILTTVFGPCPSTTTTSSTSTTTSTSTSTTSTTSTSSTSTTTAPVYYTFGDSGRGNTVPEACSDSAANARIFYSNCDNISFGAGCFVYIDNIGTALSGYTVLVMNGSTWDIDNVTGFVYGLSAVQC